MRLIVTKTTALATLPCLCTVFKREPGETLNLGYKKACKPQQTSAYSY